MRLSLSFGIVFLALDFALLYGCASRSQVRTHNNMNSVLWYQNALEFSAHSRQVFYLATQELTRAKQNRNRSALEPQMLPSNWRSLPQAVVLDLDETVLDNTAYEAQAILEGFEHNEDVWDDWVSRRAALAMPGAVEFVKAARAQGVKVFYITNRRCSPREKSSPRINFTPVDFQIESPDCPQKHDSIENLVAVGFPRPAVEEVLMVGEALSVQGAVWSRNKSERRKFVASRYRMLLNIGDDLHDFVDADEVSRSQGQAESNNRWGERWGRDWFLLSNSKYGSWLRSLEKPIDQHLRGYR